eukprot:6541525-Alexandrium_andersonii.AAC.1
MLSVSTLGDSLLSPLFRGSRPISWGPPFRASPARAGLTLIGNAEAGERCADACSALHLHAAGAHV